MGKYKFPSVIPIEKFQCLKHRIKIVVPNVFTSIGVLIIIPVVFTAILLYFLYYCIVNK